MKFIPHTRSREVEAWLRREAGEQKRRYRKIVQEQETLSAKRDRWIAQFLERIQKRGFNVHSDQLRRIRPEEIPMKPRRRFRVVF